MSDKLYTPDCWQVVEFKSGDNEPIRKVMGGWYGGFSNGDSWRLSSGIESVTETDNCYIVKNYSGSTYECHKNAERMSGYMMGIYSGWEKQAEDSNGEFSIKIVSIM